MLIMLVMQCMQVTGILSGKNNWKKTGCVFFFDRELIKRLYCLNGDVN